MDENRYIEEWATECKNEKLGGMKIEEIFNEKFIDILEYIMLL